MKTFKQFIEESDTTLRLVRRSAELIHKNPDVYKNLLKKASERLNPKDSIDYPGRTSARRDKTLIPSHRTSSFPELAGISTKTKDPKKLRKQKALKEID
jgi:hypothetical protein